MKRTIKVFVEMGKKKTWVGGVDWPGWCRSGRDEESALQAFVDCGARYAQVLSASGIEFRPPADPSELNIEERNQGNASTDFGVPAIALNSDHDPVDPQEFERWQIILEACWLAFDMAVEQAADRELSKGPRGGGRDLGKIINHVIEADQEYLRRLAWKHKREAGNSPADDLAQVRQSIRNAVKAAAAGNLPERGPRGGTIWQPRYFIRRAAWHVLDHAWEIEDRART